MSMSTLTIVTGLPNSGQSEYCKSKNYVPFKRIEYSLIAEAIKEGRDVVIQNEAFINHSQRKNLLQNLSYHTGVSYRKVIVICTKPYKEIPDNEFSLLCSFEFPLKNEEFDQIIIINKPTNVSDSILYSARGKSHREIMDLMGQIYQSKGYISGAYNFDIGLLYPNDTLDKYVYYDNIGGYIVASNADTIRLHVDPEIDSKEKLDMIFLVNYNNRVNTLSIAQLLEQFGEHETRILMDFNACRSIIQNQANKVYKEAGTVE